MDKRSMRELVERFNGTIATMDIEKEYKSQLVGMVIAMGEKYDNDVTQQKYILRVNSHVRKEELRKISEELKRQSDNIIIVPYNVDVVYPVIQGWIPVTDRLPDKPGKYLVTVQNGNVYAGTYDAYSQKFQCAAIAWMPLPEPYEATS